MRVWQLVIALDSISLEEKQVAAQAHTRFPHFIFCSTSSNPYFPPAHFIVLLTNAEKIEETQTVTTEAASMHVLLYLGFQAQLLNDSSLFLQNNFSFCYIAKAMLYYTV